MDMVIGNSEFVKSGFTDMRDGIIVTRDWVCVHQQDENVTAAFREMFPAAPARANNLAIHKFDENNGGANLGWSFAVSQDYRSKKLASH